jgi:hypothetical protein
MGDVGDELIEVALLNFLQPICKFMKYCVLRCVRANGEASTTLVSPTSLKARAIALATEAGKPDAWLTL